MNQILLRNVLLPSDFMYIIVVESNKLLMTNQRRQKLYFVVKQLYGEKYLSTSEPRDTGLGDSLLCACAWLCSLRATKIQEYVQR